MHLYSRYDTPVQSLLVLCFQVITSQWFPLKLINLYPILFPVTLSGVECLGLLGCAVAQGPKPPRVDIALHHVCPNPQDTTPCSPLAGCLQLLLRTLHRLTLQQRCSRLSSDDLSNHDTDVIMAFIIHARLNTILNSFHDVVNSLSFFGLLSDGTTIKIYIRIYFVVSIRLLSNSSNALLYSDPIPNPKSM
jgi:hypothetical protein